MTEPARAVLGPVASMWVGNLMLVILNLPLIGIWVKLLKVPYRFLFPAILVFCGRRLHVSNSTFCGSALGGILRRGRFRAERARLRAGADDPRFCARAR